MFDGYFKGAILAENLLPELITTEEIIQYELSSMYFFLITYYYAKEKRSERLAVFSTLFNRIGWYFDNIITYDDRLIRYIKVKLADSTQPLIEKVKFFNRDIQTGMNNPDTLSQASNFVKELANDLTELPSQISDLKSVIPSYASKSSNWLDGLSKVSSSLSIADPFPGLINLATYILTSDASNVDLTDIPDLPKLNVGA